MPGAPYLSIVLTGRNDGYGGDFLARFLATLRFNSRELDARGVPYEVVLVEWAPPSGVPLLADLLDSRLSPETAAVVRTVVVDPAYHDAVSLNPRLRYQEFMAKNVGIRRARGRFVLTTNCDVFLGRQVLATFQHQGLESGVVYRAARHDLDGGIEFGGIDWSALEDPGRLAGPIKPLRPPYYSRGSGDFILLRREDFDRVGGFNEVYRVARVGIDHNFLVQALACGLRIADIGGPVYHISHEGSFRVTRQQYQGREAEAHYGNVRWHSSHVVYRNPETWGLMLAPERRVSERRTVLDFLWDAVPALVALDRIVLPAAHSRPAGPSPQDERAVTGHSGMRSA